MAEHAAVCSSCGVTTEAPRPVIGKTGIFRDNWAGALAYVTFIPAVVFLLREPYKRNRFIRFHSWQSVLLTIAVVLAAVLSFPALGHLIVLLAWSIIFVGCVILWLLLMVKALQGEMFKLPGIGSLAEKQAGSIR
jgi:uncharacterized membrane protein